MTHSLWLLCEYLCRRLRKIELNVILVFVGCNRWSELTSLHHHQKYVMVLSLTERDRNPLQMYHFSALTLEKVSNTFIYWHDNSIYIYISFSRNSCTIVKPNRLSVVQRIGVKRKNHQNAGSHSNLILILAGLFWHREDTVFPTCCSPLTSPHTGIKIYTMPQKRITHLVFIWLDNGIRMSSYITLFWYFLPNFLFILCHHYIHLGEWSEVIKTWSSTSHFFCKQPLAASIINQWAHL